MYLTKQERDELSDLSQQVFGKRSHWQKMVNKGVPEAVTKRVIKEVANEAGEITQEETLEPVLNSLGKRQLATKYYTVEEAKEYMLKLKAQFDEIRATIEKQNQEKKEKAEQEAQQEAQLKQIHEENSGSAV